jgi:hypothetical protein
MKQYRKTIPLDREKDYWFVELGPISGMPAWHEQSKTASYPFPTAEAAKRFALAHERMWPGRRVEVIYA